MQTKATKLKTTLTALLISMTIGACSSTVDQHGQEVSANMLTPTTEGWSSSIPLANMLQYQLIDVRNDKPILIDLADSDGGLSDYNIVFIGENHRHPGNHLAQADIYQKMLEGGQPIMLSLEQFERDTQATLDAYLAGDIGEWALRHYGRAWGNYRTSYRPLVEMAKQRGLPVIAANAPKDTVTCTGRHGLEVLDLLPPERKNQVAKSFYTPEEGAYFEKFAGAMSHGNNSAMSKRSLNSYHAQVVRDDTMAESIHLAMESNPSHKVVHLNGHFHSASGLGTVERLARLRDDKIAVIQPILVEDPAAPSFTREDISTGDYLLLIYPLGAEVITDENRKVWRQHVFKRSNPDCSFGADAQK